MRWVLERYLEGQWRYVWTYDTKRVALRERTLFTIRVEKPHRIRRARR